MDKKGEETENFWEGYIERHRWFDPRIDGLMDLLRARSDDFLQEEGSVLWIGFLDGFCFIFVERVIPERREQGTLEKWKHVNVLNKVMENSLYTE